MTRYRMNAEWTRTRFSDILQNSDWFAFLLRGFIKQQRVPVYPVERVFFAEIRGRTTGFYALNVTKYFARVAVTRTVVHSSRAGGNWHDGTMALRPDEIILFLTA